MKGGLAEVGPEGGVGQASAITRYKVDCPVTRAREGGAEGHVGGGTGGWWGREEEEGAATFKLAYIY